MCRCQRREAAVDAASQAFKSWSKKTAQEHSELLTHWYQLVQENKEKMASLMTKE
ncbi:aldehyde dehydrogenase family protein [Alteribacillus sp. JSM 102045]|uniref:aldehyde dehydrogenase family protein n=1 Tax=Alteribacillus sp. JSM 102045 TaxID=1562101 RepID=UPI0035BF2770